MAFTTRKQNTNNKSGVNKHNEFGHWNNNDIDDDYDNCDNDSYWDCQIYTSAMLECHCKIQHKNGEKMRKYEERKNLEKCWKCEYCNSINNLKDTLTNRNGKCINIECLGIYKPQVSHVEYSNKWETYNLQIKKNIIKCTKRRRRRILQNNYKK